jgi:hypothetical protein
VDSKENKKALEGDELNADELETVTGAMKPLPGNPPSCAETSDTGMMGCTG